MAAVETKLSELSEALELLQVPVSPIDVGNMELIAFCSALVCILGFLKCCYHRVNGSRNISMVFKLEFYKNCYDCSLSVSFWMYMYKVRLL